jgi:hypothetical protein
MFVRTISNSGEMAVTGKSQVAPIDAVPISQETQANSLA